MMRRNHLYPTFFTALLLSLVPLVLLASSNRRLVLEQLLHLAPYVASAGLGFLGLRLNERPIFYLAFLLGVDGALLRERSASFLAWPALNAAAAVALSLPVCLYLLFFVAPILPERAKNYFYPATVGGPTAIAVLLFKHWPEFTQALAEGCYTLCVWAIIGFALLAPLTKSRLLREVRVFTSLAFLPVLWCLAQILRHKIETRELDITIPLAFLSAQIILGAVMFRLYWQKVYLDELTGLANRRALNERLPKLESQYCIAMIDVDHFKAFNDNYGHEQGDQVLRLVSRVLENEFGADVYRYGGEEFCAVFEGIDVGRVAQMMNTAREKLATREFTIRASLESRKATSKKNRSEGSYSVRPKTNVTVSSGIASASDSLRRPEDVLIAADAALYQAKQNGRNRVVVAAYDARKKAASV